MARAKPFLRWAGSKRKQIHTASGILVERFQALYRAICRVRLFVFRACSSSCYSRRQQWTFIEVFEVVRDEPEAIYRRLQDTSGRSDVFALAQIKSVRPQSEHASTTVRLS